MKTKQIKLIAIVATSLASTALFTGCATSGYQQADKTGAGIAQFREEIAKTKLAVDDTVTALGQVAVTANTNPRNAFKQFSKSLANLESTSAKAKRRGEDMKAQGQAYFADWEKQLAQLKNQDIKNLAVQQKAKLQTTFDSIRNVAAPLKAQFDPWLSDLQDLQKYLSTDLSISGVDAAKGMFAKTQTEGLEVQKSMDALVAELNTVAAALTPANVPPPAKK
ncbi:MAG: DUF2959 family protein [Verrucomicrobiota bacterium]|nr:DUF2959 family protein [Verrucomicrobiota bacterium]MCC6823054.1 DUF2959 family protein [Limisphaerales bacterium]